VPGLTSSGTAAVGAGTVLDHVDVMATYTVPTTAVSAVTAVAVPGFTVTPTCPAGVIVVRAYAVLSHGATGWSAGRNVNVFIGDATVNAVSPVFTGAFGYTNSQVTGANTQAYMEASYPIAAADVGTKTFKLYAYVSNAALTGAFVYGAPEALSFIEAVVGG
jgi:hypothetical protein